MKIQSLKILCKNITFLLSILFLQVSVSFDQTTVQPADDVTVTVNAYPGSYVGLLAVDQSVLLLKSGNDVTQSTVERHLSC